MKAKVYLYNTKRKDKQLKNKSNMETRSSFEISEMKKSIKKLNGMLKSLTEEETEMEQTRNNHTYEMKKLESRNEIFDMMNLMEEMTSIVSTMGYSAGCWDNWEERNFQLAKAAMQGFIASGKFPYTEEDGFEKLATYSIEMADEMVEQLKEYKRHEND